MSLDLRPLTLAELLDRSFFLYKRHLWLFVGIMSAPAVLLMVFAILFRLFNSDMQPGMPPDQVFRQIVALMIGTFLFGILYTTVHLFALGAATIAVSELYLGREATVGGSYRGVRRHVGRLLILMILAALRVGGAVFGLIFLTGVLAALAAVLTPLLSVLVFGLGFVGAAVLFGFMTARYGVGVPALLLEDIRAGAALRRSVDLSADNRGRILLLILCAAVIAYATALICQGPFVLASVVAGPGTRMSHVLGLVGAVLGAIGGMFSGPLMIISLALMYYDLRIRKEALDLHILLENLDAPAQS
jgi:hypothetical protein